MNTHVSLEGMAAAEARIVAAFLKTLCEEMPAIHPKDLAPIAAAFVAQRKGGMIYNSYTLPPDPGLSRRIEDALKRGPAV